MGQRTMPQLDRDYARLRVRADPRDRTVARWIIRPQQDRALVRNPHALVRLVIYPKLAEASCDRMVADGFYIEIDIVFVG